MTPKKQKSPILVRPARLSDAWAMVALEEACFDQDRWQQSSYEYYLRRKTVLGFMVEIPDEAISPVGCALVYKRKNGPVDIYSLAVHPDFRGRGVGAAMLHSICAAAKAHPGKKLSLCVRQDNSPAIALYERFGFVVAGIKHGYYEGGVNALTMRCDLNPMPG